jgi:hypothetical protein
MIAMVSSNLADLMGATRPRSSQPLHETLDKEADPSSLGRLDSQPLTKSEHSEPDKHNDLVG